MRFVDVAGEHLSAVGLGTWQFGSPEWGYGSDYARHEAGRIVERALELGVNVFDTAEVYGFGRSERILGEALRGRRKGAFVATKVFPALPLARVVEQRGARSARRLHVHAVDLYQVHWPNPLVPLGTTMEGMRRLREAGRIRHVGVSNFSARRWAEAERLLGAPVLADQVSYSLADRAAERSVIPYARDHDRLVVAYSPLAQGLLSARYSAEHRPSGFTRRTNTLFTRENLERARPLLDALTEIGRVHGATPAQVALAWVIRGPNVVAIPGASSVEQLEANAAAADLELSEDEHARLDEVSAAFDPRRGLAAAGDLAAPLLRR